MSDPSDRWPHRTPWSTEPVLQMSGVSVRYSDDGRLGPPVLKDVDLTLHEGEILLVVGRTGAGKSTLLGAMTGAVPHFTGGELTGTVRVLGRDTRTHPPRMLADVVGVVGQDPLAGFVTDTVEEELAYGMEQLGLGAALMRKRVEETLDLLGIAELRDVPLAELSGGQQQRVALGSVLTTRPGLVILDEPTSALDPNGSEDVLATVTRLAHDLAVTVVIAEHRIERVLQYVDRVAHVGADGRVDVADPRTAMTTSDVAPPVIELGRWAGWDPLPLSIRDARTAGTDLRRALFTAPASGGAPAVPAVAPGGRAVSPGARAVSPAAPTARRYAATDRAVAGPAPAVRARGIVVDFGPVRAVDHVDLHIAPGEVCALMGRNGCGKSSLLWALQGTGRRSGGTVRVNDDGAVTRAAATGGGADPADLAPLARRRLVGLVPQNPTDLLCHPTVARELAASDDESGARPGATRSLLDDLAPGIGGDLHPRDLSEGQRLALTLAIQLTAQPGVVLLDEPTRGLDYTAKAALSESLRGVAASGRAVVVATHDVEFAAMCATRALVMAAGEIVADGPATEILSGAPAYAPQVAKVTAGVGVDSSWLTLDEVRVALGEVVPCGR